jgi:hypothetical protein
MAIRSEPSLQARKFLEDNYPRVNLPETMIRLQERVFSKDETERIKEGEQYKALTVIGTWRQLRNCSVPRAVIDIVHSLDGIGWSLQLLTSEKTSAVPVHAGGCFANVLHYCHTRLSHSGSCPSGRLGGQHDRKLSRRVPSASWEHGGER